jgi:hypothetical protein
MNRRLLQHVQHTTRYIETPVERHPHSVHRSLWAGIFENTIFRYAATLQVAAQIAARKQWRYIGVWILNIFEYKGTRKGL